jgi:hypothetical protein
MPGRDAYIVVEADLYEGVTFAIGPLSEWEANIIVFEIANKAGIPVRKLHIEKEATLIASPSTSTLRVSADQRTEV